MAKRMTVCALGAAVAGIFSGCGSSPFDTRDRSPFSYNGLISSTETGQPASVYRAESEHAQAITLDATVESYLRYALYHSAEIEGAYQRWRVASERLPQVSALPDPRLNMGFFLYEVETRVGAQQSRVGLRQTLPWIGKLRDREDAANRGALAAWYDYQEVQLRVVEGVMVALHDLAFLEAATRMTGESAGLLRSFEEVVRARYRVGGGAHPELIRVQVELGLLEDRVVQLESLRPARVAALNGALNRPAGTDVMEGVGLDDLVVALEAEELAGVARMSSPVLLAMDEQVEQQRMMSEVARKDGYPDLTIGIDYIVTDGRSGVVSENGDDPILVSFGINLPIWREKYDAGVRETIARRLSISRAKDARANAIDSAVYQAWFDHTDADRRVRLYEDSLLPKAKESLAASLGGFRTGESEFLDLLDTQRTLLEFGIAVERARADRRKALARLNRLVGRPVQTVRSGSQHNDAVRKDQK